MDVLIDDLKLVACMYLLSSTVQFTITIYDYDFSPFCVKELLCSRWSVCMSVCLSQSLCLCVYVSMGVYTTNEAAQYIICCMSEFD